MRVLLKTEFITKDGEIGNVITRKRQDGMYVTTFKPRLGFDFYSMDTDKKNSHETVKRFLRDVKGCRIPTDEGKEPVDPPVKPKRFIP